MTINGSSPASLSFIFDLLQTPIYFFQQIDVKNVNPVNSVWIRTQIIQNMILLS